MSITANIMDTKDYLRGPDGADKSVSISFTSVGKALAARSGSQHKYTPAVDDASKVAATVTSNTQGITESGAGAGPGFSDLMALEDVSGGSGKSQSFSGQSPTRESSSRARASAGAGATTGLGGMPMLTPMALEGGSAQIPQQAKVVDAGLRTIIGDMLRAIEVAVWDAAMER